MNRKLFKSIREYRRESILAPVFVILEVLMEVLIPLQMAKIIDVGIAQGNLPYIVRMGVILVAMAMIALFFGAMAGKFAAVAAAAMPKICAMTFFIRYRTFHSKISTIFPLQALSQGLPRTSQTCRWLI